MRLDTPYPDPRGPKRWPGASAVHLAETLLKKVAGYPNLVGGRSPVWAPNPEELGPCVDEPWCLTLRESL